jgi:hypothetical protein
MSLLIIVKVKPMKIKKHTTKGCGRLCYSKIGASDAIVNAFFINSKTDETPIRSYYCKRCDAYHLSSTPLRLK